MVYQLVNLGTTKPYIRHFLNYLTSLAIAVSIKSPVVATGRAVLRHPFNRYAIF